MAIYHLTHRTVGRSTHAAGTAGAHLGYITRAGACRAVIADHIPTASPGSKGGAARSWMDAAEAGDRKNARVIDKLEIALPLELDQAQRVELVRAYVRELAGGASVPFFAAIHDKAGTKDEANPHAHIVLRDRHPETGKRVIGMSEKGSTERAREIWERVCNEALSAAQSDARIDRRSLTVQAAEATEAAQEATEAQRRAQKALNPIGKRQRVQEATERATKATERATALARPPTRHRGPGFDAQDRREAQKAAEAAAKAKAKADREAREAAARDAEAEKARRAAADEEARDLHMAHELAGLANDDELTFTRPDSWKHQIYHRAVEIVFEIRAMGAASWLKGFFGPRFSPDQPNEREAMFWRWSAKNGGPRDADRLTSPSPKTEAVIGWAAAVAEDRAANPAEELRQQRYRAENPLPPLQPAPRTPAPQPRPPEPAPQPAPQPKPRPRPQEPEQEAPPPPRGPSPF